MENRTGHCIMPIIDFVNSIVHEDPPMLGPNNDISFLHYFELSGSDWRRRSNLQLAVSKNVIL